MAILIRRGIIPPVSSTPTSSDSDVTAWIAAVIAAGGTVSQSRANTATTMVTSMKAGANSWNTLDRLWFLAFANEHSKQAQIDLKNLQSWTQVGSGTLGTGGWTGDGATGYLNSNYNPATAGGNWATNGTSLSMGVYNKSSSGTINLMMIGAYAGSGVATMLYMSAYAAPNAVITSYESISDAGTPTNTINIGGGTAQSGRWNAVATGGSHFIYANGVDRTGTAGSAAASTASLNLFIGAKNNSSGADSFSTDQLAVAHMGGGMSSTQAAEFDNAISATGL